MVILYLDQTEIDMMDTGHGFTASDVPKPEEWLIVPVNVNEDVYSMLERRGYVVCRRKDGKEGDSEAFRERYIERNPVFKKILDDR